MCCISNYQFSKKNVKRISQAMPRINSKFFLLFFLLVNCIYLKESNFDNNSTLSQGIFLWKLLQSQGISVSPAPSHFTAAEYITISAKANAKIYYTTDGTEPSTSSYEYKEPIHIWQLAGAKLKVIAVKSGTTISQISLNDYYSYPNLKTGQNDCWDQAGGSIPCSNTYQDGEYQKGINFSYTGPMQHAQFPNDYTTKDNSTGLIWKSCSEGQSGGNCTGANVKSNWINAQTGANGCKILNSANSGSGYAGRTDWRLPSVEELLTILYNVPVGSNNSIPRILSSAFPNNASGAGNLGTYWTSTDTANFPFSVDFSIGNASNIVESNATLLNVRCVAGTTTTRTAQFTDNGNDTITDHRTRLLWQKCSWGQSGSSCTGVPITNNWQSSLTNCHNSNLAGLSWRLPSMNEQLSLMNYNQQISQWMDPTVFPNIVPNSEYWTSTTYTNFAPSKVILYSNGQLGGISGANNYTIRCVSN
jgi:hypothetical protein